MDNGHVAKACESCRKSKTRCDGEAPCERCRRRNSDCSYRVKARNRQRIHRRVTNPASASPKTHSEARRHSPAGSPTPNHEASDVLDSQAPSHMQMRDDNVYQSVIATHGDESSSAEHSRLFYGPSSQFAFLQQIHRKVLSSDLQKQSSQSDVQDGGPGLDLFRQRSIFFGTPSRISPRSNHTSDSISSTVPLSQAKDFLNRYKTIYCGVFPLFTDTELDDLFRHLYDEESENVLTSHTKAIALAILANGGLAAGFTNLAEKLFVMANQEAIFSLDVVSLPAIQLLILLSEYQNNMGRPNSVYLHLGVACRKALAMGLHRESNATSTNPNNVSKRQATLWCLYFNENFQSLALGRESAIKMADISTPLPSSHTVLASLCKLAHIAEDGARVIYGLRHASLGKLYVAAEEIHVRIREFAAESGIGSPGFANRHKIPDGIASLIIHNVYYHTILLTFRPFLIAESALPSTQNNVSPQQVWLRQASRYAVNAAQDSIAYASYMFQKDDVCRSSRYNAFFLDASCVVLLFDILQHPSKHACNVEYIQMALLALSSMDQDEPVTTCSRSIEQTLRIVERTISGQRTDSAARDFFALTNHPLHWHPQQSHQAIQFPSLDPNLQNSADQLIQFRDLPGSVGEELPQVSEMPSGAESNGCFANPYSPYDIVATDLYNFFPVNNISPYDPVHFAHGEDINP
ncbi:hypothetical protein M426DRAFT_322431 [Hypoxylon sp. CI-4A]|nr:hypothetical protein M426DRAFT_322431 [Hypoxylon sp. CI-4A]